MCVSTAMRGWHGWYSSFSSECHYIDHTKSLQFLLELAALSREREPKKLDHSFHSTQKIHTLEEYFFLIEST